MSSSTQSLPHSLDVAAWEWIPLSKLSLNATIDAAFARHLVVIRKLSGDCVIRSRHDTSMRARRAQ